MKPIVETILRSGLVDKHTVEMMEKWGNLPEGAADLVQEDALKHATKAQITNLVEEIAELVESDKAIKETQLDLGSIRWPAFVKRIERPLEEGTGPHELALRKTVSTIARDIPAIIDRMGRLYFRTQDVHEEWLVPGYLIEREVRGVVVSEQINEVTPLFVDETCIAWQVSVR